jgi:hypothetical protein
MVQCFRHFRTRRRFAYQRRVDLSDLNRLTIAIKGEWDSDIGYAITAYCTELPRTAEEAISLACCLLDDMKARLAGELMKHQEKARKEVE